MVAIAVVVAMVLLLVVVSLRVRRHGEAVVPAAGWASTEEVFIDPGTGRRMRVWIDPVDSSRHYVPERTGPDRG